MPTVLLWYRVEDFARWYPVYIEDAAARRASGSRGARLFRNADDPDEVIVLLEWDDLERARQFVRSAALRAALARAGIADQPEVLVLEEIERTPV
jgi:heme-degrading monooxygenase HmoA